MASEVTVGGNVYRVGALNALQQLHVSRRIAPVMATMGISLAQLRGGASLDLDAMMTSLGPMAEVVSNMSDEHVEYIIATCMGAVLRKQGADSWAPTVQGALPMFADIDMPTMLRLTVQVIMNNLAGFLKEPGAPAASPSS